MNKTKTISKAFLPITLRAWLAIGILAIVSSFEVIKVIHVDHHHNDEIAICTESDETNACHRSLVHFDAEAGCEHTQHLDKIVAACEICDALTTTYLFEVSPVVLAPIEFAAIEQTTSPVEKSFSTSITFPALRGPPALS